MVDAGTVEYQHWSPGPVLHVVDQNLAYLDVHPSRLIARGRRNNASRAGSSSMLDVGATSRATTFAGPSVSMSR